MKLLAMVLGLMLTGIHLLNASNEGTEKDSVNQHFNWFNEDLSTDNILGLGTDRAFNELLTNKASKTVIVAVIDSGVDIDHEDLEGKIWTNEDEIPDNGIDDDENGYVDDVHGWNFIGGPEGNIVNETLEVTRLYRQMKGRFQTLKSADVSDENRSEYQRYLQIKKEYEKELAQAQQMNEQWEMLLMTYEYSEKLVKEELGKAEYSYEELQGMEEQNEMMSMAKGFLLQVMESGIGFEDIEGMAEHFQSSVDYYLNPEYNPREVVGDDPNDPRERFYGNNDVKGERSDHGTHVAGIIGAVRTNDVGIKGIVDNVKIMSIRAVPNGDERDKDIANAIRYAVENGAKVINMSFGKPYSPSKAVVDEAFKYAEENDVLIVHGAGNEGADIDARLNFPNPFYDDGKTADNWLTVGASAKAVDENLAASFSNYGQKNVDLFAPGVDVYSLQPEDQYVAQDGTSMACPMVSGVAALLFAYFPDLTTDQVKSILLKSVTRQKKVKVKKPQNQSLEEEPEMELIKFGQLSATGGVLNAYEAVRLAAKKSKL